MQSPTYFAEYSLAHECHSARIEVLPLLQVPSQINKIGDVAFLAFVATSVYGFATRFSGLPITQTQTKPTIRQLRLITPVQDPLIRRLPTAMELPPVYEDTSPLTEASIKSTWIGNKTRKGDDTTMTHDDSYSFGIDVLS